MQGFGWERCAPRVGVEPTRVEPILYRERAAKPAECVESWFPSRSGNPPALALLLARPPLSRIPSLGRRIGGW